MLAFIRSILLFTIFSTACLAQDIDTIHGTMGFRLWDDLDKITSEKLKGYELYKSETVTRLNVPEYHIWIKGGLYMRWEPAVTRLSFREKVLGDITVYFLPKTVGEAYEMYDEMLRKLIAKYGDDFMEQTDVRDKRPSEDENEFASTFWMIMARGIYLRVGQYSDSGDPYVNVTYRDYMMMNKIGTSDDY